MASSDVYWPPGWSRERLVHASGDDIGALDPDEWARMLDSLRAALGVDGYQELVQEMRNNEKAARAAQEGNFLDKFTPDQRFRLLKTLRDNCPEGPFGWVVYRACCYDDETRWTAFRKKWTQFIDSQVEPNINVPGVREAMARFEIRWIENDKFESMEPNDAAAHYRSLEPTLPMGLRLGMCLVVGESELQSVLDLPCPTPTPIDEQPLIPYALGVLLQAGEDLANDQLQFEEHGSQTTFKVALSALIGDLAFVLLEDIMPAAEVSIGVRENIWMNMSGRQGIFKIGASQSD